MLNIRPVDSEERFLTKQNKTKKKNAVSLLMHCASVIDGTVFLSKEKQ